MIIEELFDIKLKKDGTYEISKSEFLYKELSNMDKEINKDLCNITIPHSYNGKTVTSIVEYGFSWCKRLKSVVIPSSVNKIGYYSFMGCEDLKSVIIADSITSIEVKPFMGYKLLQYREYNNTYYLGNKTNPYLILVKTKSIDISLCKINDKCKIIWDEAFRNCFNLKNVVIPKSVKKIGIWAFINCKNLTNVVIENSETKIETYAFENCKNLKYIMIENRTIKIK